jgi:hypothetical protein
VYFAPGIRRDPHEIKTCGQKNNALTQQQAENFRRGLQGWMGPFATLSLENSGPKHICNHDILMDDLASHRIGEQH